MKTYQGETGEVYKTSFAWTAQLRSFNDKPTEDRIFCAWCKKSKEEIRKTEDPDIHIENHATPKNQSQPLS